MSINQILIADIPVRQDAKGRHSLNDLHKAAGGHRKHGPALWMENQQTKDLISEIAQEIGDTGNPVSVVKGGLKQGTYVCKELVYAYAMWVSAAFNLKVIRTFDKAMTDVGDWRKLRHATASTTKMANDLLKFVRTESGKDTESHHYSNEARLVNWALTGEFKGVPRDTLPTDQLDKLAYLQERNAVLIGRGLTYEQRKPMIAQYAKDWVMKQAVALAKSAQAAIKTEAKAA